MRPSSISQLFFTWWMFQSQCVPSHWRFSIFLHLFASMISGTELSNRAFKQHDDNDDDDDDDDASEPMIGSKRSSACSTISAIFLSGECMKHKRWRVRGMHRVSGLRMTTASFQLSFVAPQSLAATSASHASPALLGLTGLTGLTYG